MSDGLPDPTLLPLTGILDICEALNLACFCDCLKLARSKSFSNLTYWFLDPPKLTSAIIRIAKAGTIIMTKLFAIPSLHISLYLAFKNPLLMASQYKVEHARQYSIWMPKERWAGLQGSQVKLVGLKSSVLWHMAIMKILGKCWDLIVR
jgi:hypothetical protein